MTIGQQATGGDTFTGQVEDVAILPSALSASQISSLFAAGGETSTPFTWSATPACGNDVHVRGSG